MQMSWRNIILQSEISELSNEITSIDSKFSVVAV